MMLWILLTLMIALASAGLTMALVRRREAAPGQGVSREILKAQLDEVDAQLSAGVLVKSQADALRAEIGRRILSEAHEAATPARPIPAHAVPWVALGLVAVVALSASVLYALMGHPERGDSPPTQAAAAPAPHPMGDVATIIAGLEARLQQAPGDAQGWQMLGWSYMRTGRTADAARAYGRAAAIDPGNAEYLSAQGEAIIQDEGRVSDAAASLFHRVLKIDPADPRARYFLAVLREQQGDHAGALADLLALLKSAPPDAPWVAQVRSYAQDKAREQGVDISGQLPPPAPTGAEVAAAGQMSDTARQQMIHGMVEKLAGELRADPHNADGWVRLMRARMVLGEKDQAQAAWRDAQKAFAGAPAQQAALRDAAQSLGIVPR